MKDKAIPKAWQIYELLRRSIVSLKMQPGMAISAKEVCAAYGISRIPCGRRCKGWRLKTL